MFGEDNKAKIKYVSSAEADGEYQSERTIEQTQFTCVRRYLDNPGDPILVIETDPLLRKIFHK